MMTAAELKEWVAALKDTDLVAIDEGGLTLETRDGEAWIEIGGWPGEDA